MIFSVSVILFIVAAWMLPATRTGSVRHVVTTPARDIQRLRDRGWIR